MNSALIHLLTTHLPVLGILFASILMLYGLIRKSKELKRAALIGYVLTALTGIPAYLSGEEAEDMVEGLPGVTEQYIEEHEDFAKFSFIGIEIVGVISLAGLYASRKNANMISTFSKGVILPSLVVVGMMAWTAHLGGMIRHTEIRSGNVQTQNPSSGSEDKD
jgi:hypothetical protein